MQSGLQANVTAMKIRWSILAVGIVGTVVGFLLNGQSPVGGALWPPEQGHVQPEGSNLALLMVMGVIEAVAFGAGCAFAVAAWGWAKSRSAGAWTWPVYLAVTWSLVNWVPHTGLHMMVGNITGQADFAGLAAIEYGFHFTLIVGGAVLATYVVRSAAAHTWRPSAKDAAPSAGTARKPA
jgi:hypothetical protein